MTFNEELVKDFHKDIFHMKEYVEKITAIEKALDVDLWEGLVGQMMDELFEFRILPYTHFADLSDEEHERAVEWLWSLVLFEKDSDLDDINRFADKYLKEYKHA